MQTAALDSDVEIPDRFHSDRSSRVSRSDKVIDKFGEWPSIAIVLGLCAFVFAELQPNLLFSGNLDVGGDNAAHVVAVSYFVHQLLSHGQLSGWDPQWFDGFPLYVFYFPLPAVLVAALNVAFPYAVAFDLVTVLGSVLLPLAAYAFGRLAGFSRPFPLFMSLASLAFLFNTSYTIDGGNIASTLAGEFSFSLALTLGLVFLGLFTRSLRTGRGRALAAIFYAATVLSHVVPGLFFGAAALVFALAQADRRRSLLVFATTCGIGALLSGFWLLRFAADLGYSSSMNYVRVPDVIGHLFPRTLELSVQCLAGVGTIIGLVTRNRVILCLVVLAIASVVAFAFLPDGLVYNERWQPFWYLTTTLLAGYALSEVACFVVRKLDGHELATLSSMAIATLVIVGVVAANQNNLPFYSTPAAWRSFVPDWTTFNYTGYQGKVDWPEFERIIAMLKSAGATYGCGRLDYEYTANTTTPFGSTLVEMSFPYWTNGCIDSTEGVYYESSTTNDYHFLDQSELSISSSDPVAGLPYEPTNVADGVLHLQLMGVKYFLANSPQIEAQANADPQLIKIASTPATSDAIETPTATVLGTGPLAWTLYEVRNAPLVASLKYLPVVESGQSKAAWLATSIDWYQHPDFWSVPIVRSGPSSWESAPDGALVSARQSQAVTPTTVSHITTTNASIAFDVTETGVPVLVKVPYFPNWHVSGAAGPFESSPNLMIVVPSSHHVVLHYGTTRLDWVGRAGSGLGLIALLGLSRYRLSDLSNQGLDEDLAPAGSDQQIIGDDRADTEAVAKDDEQLDEQLDRGDDDNDEPTGPAT